MSVEGWGRGRALANCRIVLKLLAGISQPHLVREHPALHCAAFPVLRGRQSTDRSDRMRLEIMSIPFLLLCETIEVGNISVWGGAVSVVWCWVVEGVLVVSIYYCHSYHQYQLVQKILCPRRQVKWRLTLENASHHCIDNTSANEPWFLINTSRAIRWPASGCILDSNRRAVFKQK